MQDKNSIGFYHKNETRTKQCSDQKKTYPKLITNKQEVMRNSTFIYIYWAFSLIKFLNKLSTYMWFMFTHVCPCARMCEPCVPICEL